MVKPPVRHLLKPTTGILRAILRHYRFKLVSFKIPPKGVKNTTAIVETDQGNAVVRIYPRGDKTKNEILHEVGFMTYLREHSIPVPRVFSNCKGEIITTYLKDGFRWSAVVMEFMEGENPKAYSAKLLRELARNQARMHRLGIEHAWQKRYKGKGLSFHIERERQSVRKIDLSVITKLEVREFLKRAKKFSLRISHTLPHGFSHMDYVRGNLLVRDDRLASVVDFGDIVYCPVVVCLGYTVYSALYVAGDIRQSHAYLSHYSSVRKLTKQEIRHLKEVMLFRNYMVGARGVLDFGENYLLMPKFIEWEREISKTTF